MSGIIQYIEFIRELERLKNVTRTAWTSEGRQESTAEHSWRLAVFCGIMLDEFPELDGRKVLLMALTHDLGEAYDGDISAALQPDADKKYEGEQAAMERLTGLLGEPGQGKLYRIWQEYEEGLTPEARLVKALDKAETIIQHNQGLNPPDFDYGFNLQYGKDYFQEKGILKELRAALDEDTGRHTEQGKENERGKGQQCGGRPD